MVPTISIEIDFLDPERYVGHIREQAVAAADFSTTHSVAERQQQTISGIEQLADIAINAVSQKDKAMATGSLDPICDLGTTYQPKKAQLAPELFVLGGHTRPHHEFVTPVPPRVASPTDTRHLPNSNGL